MHSVATWYGGVIEGHTFSSSGKGVYVKVSRAEPKKEKRP
jgi:hypothetical protein